VEAKDLFRLDFDPDLGGDWNAWQRKLEQRLKENPDCEYRCLPV